MPTLAAPIVNALYAIGFSVNASIAIAQIAGSLLLSTAANALLAPKQNQEATRAELALPTSLPAYRTVYGHTIAPGTPAPIRVRGGGTIIYGCWILNSRPSALTNLTLYLDKREITLVGDPFDFTGDGAESTDGLFDDDKLFVWFSRGDKLTPPARILSEAPYAVGDDAELFQSTDGWQGRTVMWARMESGPSSSFQERWPSRPPQVEVVADWSKVWDFTDEAQDPDDPDTWEYSDRAALVIMDAYRNNPIKPYPLASIILEHFEAKLLVDKQAQALKAGGTEERWRLCGVINWSSGEMEDHLLPLHIACAADVVRVGGKIGITTGAWEPSSYTLTDILGGLNYVGTREGQLPTEIITSYISADRLYEKAELPRYDIPGAAAADAGLPTPYNLNCEWAASPTQAMRVQKIMGNILRAGPEITTTALPDASDLIGGAVMTVDLPDELELLNGTYRILGIHPASDPLGEGGCAARCPVRAIGHAASFYEWTPADDEVDIETSTFNAQPIATLSPPTDGIAAGAAGEITVQFTMPAQPTLEIQFYASATSTLEDATFLAASPGSSLEVKTYVHTGLGAGVTRYYWAFAVGPGGGTYSDFAGPVSDTTDP